MSLHKDQHGFAMILGVLVLAILAVGGTSYAVYLASYRPDAKPTSLQQSTTSPQTQPKPQESDTGIDYPALQGIKGRVFCNEKVDPVPCATTIEIQIQPSGPSMGSNGPVKTIETDAEGNFEYETMPGTYVITPAPKAGYPMFLPPLPNPIIVKDRQMTELNITYHSGLR